MASAPAFCSVVSSPFFNQLCGGLVRCAGLALSSAAGSTSMHVTWKPEVAATWAIPLPIVPAPTTKMCLIVIRLPSCFRPYPGVLLLLLPGLRRPFHLLHVIRDVACIDVSHLSKV